MIEREKLSSIQLVRGRVASYLMWIVMDIPTKSLDADQWFITSTAAEQINSKRTDRSYSSRLFISLERRVVSAPAAREFMNGKQRHLSRLKLNWKLKLISFACSTKPSDLDIYDLWLSYGNALSDAVQCHDKYKVPLILLARCVSWREKQLSGEHEKLKIKHQLSPYDSSFLLPLASLVSCHRVSFISLHS